VNWRAVGCGALAAAVFVAIGLLGLSMAFNRSEGCPRLLQWADRRYEPSGQVSAAPHFDLAGPPVPLGSTPIGLTTRTVYGPPGSEASPASADRPSQIALDCGDGSFQTYRLTEVLQPASANESPAPT
jgi:hypothetical protein